MEDKDRAINIGSIADAKTDNWEDYAPERIVRIYPYKTLKQKQDQPLIQTNTQTIVRISQNNLPEFKKIFIDKDGNKYLKAIIDIDASTEIGSNVSSATTREDIRTSKSFEAMIFDYRPQEDDISTFFTVKHPFNEKDYKNKKQMIYYAYDIEVGYTDSTSDLNDQDKSFLSFIGVKDGSYTNLKLQDVSLLIEDVRNASLIFTFDSNLGTNFTANDSIKLRLDKHALLHSIQGNGYIKVSGIDQGYSNFCFYAKEKLIPFKMVPINDQDKLTLIADWFDYDIAMPYFRAKIAQNGETLENIIPNESDRKFVEDMLMLSAGFSQSWADAPRYSISDVSSQSGVTRADVGRIKADYRIGHIAISIYSLLDKKPQDVIDGLYQNHLFKNPSILTNRVRRQNLKGTVTALSGLIYSSLCVGGGGNNFHQAYLPWYLDIYGTNTINLSVNKVNVAPKNENAKYTYLLEGVSYNDGKETSVSKLKLKTFSIYFTSFFSDKTDIFPDSSLKLPEKLNLSDIKQIQTDRKITLPNITNSLEVVEKMSSAGDVDLTSSKDLKYLFYLNVSDQDKFQRLFLKDAINTITTFKTGDIINVYLPYNNSSTTRLPDGDVWSQSEADKQILNLVPVDVEIVQPTIINNVWTSTKEGNKIFDSRWLTNKYYKDFPYAKWTKIPDYIIKNMLKHHFNLRPRGTFFKLDGKENRAYHPYREDHQGFIFGNNIIEPPIKELERFSYYLQKWYYRSSSASYPENLQIVDNNLEYYFIYDGGSKFAPYKFTVRGNYKYKLRYSDFSPAKVKLKKTINLPSQEYNNRQNIFDKLDWIRFTNSFDIFEKFVLDIKIDDEVEVLEINEIIISMLWSNKFALKFKNSEWIEFKTLNKNDESIGVQKIAII